MAALSVKRSIYVCEYLGLKGKEGHPLMNSQGPGSRSTINCFLSGEWGGKVSPRKSVVQSARQYDVTSRVSDFKMASKVFMEETDKNFDFITEIPFPFLGFGDFKVPVVIEN